MLIMALRECYDSSVSREITGHAEQGALPSNDLSCRLFDYYRFGTTPLFKHISWLAGEQQTSADS